MDQKNKRLEAIFIAIFRKLYSLKHATIYYKMLYQMNSLYVENETEQYHLQKRGQQLNVDNE